LTNISSSVAKKRKGPRGVALQIRKKKNIGRYGFTEGHLNLLAGWSEEEGTPTMPFLTEKREKR